MLSSGLVSYHHFTRSLPGSHTPTLCLIPRLLLKLDPSGSGQVNYNDFLRFFDSMKPLGRFNSEQEDNNVLTAAPWEQRRCVQGGLGKGD